MNRLSYTLRFFALTTTYDTKPTQCLHILGSPPHRWQRKARQSIADIVMVFKSAFPLAIIILIYQHDSLLDLVVVKYADENMKLVATEIVVFDYFLFLYS